MENVRIIKIPDCKMVSSGAGMFGEPGFDRFNAWMSAQPPAAAPQDYLYWDGAANAFCWLYLYQPGMDVPPPLTVVDFTGGLYTVVTGVDGQSNAGEMAAVDAFLAAHGFERDNSRPDLGHIITPGEAREVLGYCQMNYFTPIKIKEE